MLYSTSREKFVKKTGSRLDDRLFLFTRLDEDGPIQEDEEELDELLSEYGMNDDD